MAGTETDPPRARRWAPLLVLALVAAGFLLGGVVRADLGLEWSPDAVRATVAKLGVAAPVVFVALFAFRQFVLLPSGIGLAAGGLLFGAGLGALLGGLGLLTNAVLLFLAARLLGGDWVRERLHRRYPGFERRARVAGPAFIGLMTGHPMGVMTPFHLAAGVSGISAPVFLATVALTVPVRALSYAFLGAQLLDVGSPRFWGATAVLALLTVLPLAHPGLRRRLRAAQ